MAEPLGQSWTCPYCHRICTIGRGDTSDLSGQQFISGEYGHYHGTIRVIVCPNPECRKQAVSAHIWEYDPHTMRAGAPIFSWNLLPESTAKPFPEYIPEQLRGDYVEACLIKDKSPKASATLSRRCLQGMIRDFWGVKKSRLVDEIEGIQEKVDPSTWKAIDAVRHVGNIGAHMEKDVNLIIDVEPGEAGLLIWLIETLFTEWYVARHERETRMNALVEVAKIKAEARKVLPEGQA